MLFLSREKPPKRLDGFLFVVFVFTEWLSDYKGLLKYTISTN